MTIIWITGQRFRIWGKDVYCRVVLILKIWFFYAILSIIMSCFFLLIIFYIYIDNGLKFKNQFSKNKKLKEIQYVIS